MSKAYREPERCTRVLILKSARSAKFSSDRTIPEYCADIWRVEPVPVKLLMYEEVGIA